MKRIIYLTSCIVAMAAMFSACEKPEVEGNGSDSPSITATPKSVTFSAEGEVKNVVVTCNQDDWSFTGAPEWLTVEKEGKGALKLTAGANATLEELTGTITLTAGDASFNIDVRQEKGSKYPGYAELASAEAIYMGTMYQNFGMPDCEGGQATLILVSADERTTLSIEFFTEAYASEEEVYLPEGEYQKGDSYSSFAQKDITGTPQTWMTGGSYVLSEDEGDETFFGGTRMTYITGDVEDVTDCMDGTFTISYNEDETVLVKVDFKDAEGNDLKYYYEGALEFDVSMAMYPTAGGADPTAVTMVMGSYVGASEKGGSVVTITFVTEAYDMTQFKFCTPSESYAALDIAGSYTAVDAWTGAAGEMEAGSDGEFMPEGSYISIGFTDFYKIAAGSTLNVTKNDDGTYNFAAFVTTDDGKEYMYVVLNQAVDIHDSSADSGEDL